MPKTVGILTFTSMINTTSERLKARNYFICRYFSFYEQLKFVLSSVEHEKSFVTSGPGLLIPANRLAIVNTVEICINTASLKLYTIWTIQF